MDPTWPVGALVGVFVVARAVTAIRDAGRDVAAPFRRVADLPEPGPEDWTFRGASRFGVWAGSLIPRARLVVARDWIGVRQATVFSGVRHYRVGRDDVDQVVVVAGFPIFGAGIGVRGPSGPSGLAVLGTTRRDAEAHLDRLGWPHERRRPRLLRPFA